MIKRVYVVTGYELGWDCVVDVLDAAYVAIEDLIKVYDEDQYIIHEKIVGTAIPG